jgi:hypothetical protein
MARRKPSVVGHPVVPKSLMWRGLGRPGAVHRRSAHRGPAPTPPRDGLSRSRNLRLRRAPRARRHLRHGHAAVRDRPGALRIRRAAWSVRVKRESVAAIARAAARFAGAARRAPARRLLRTISLATVSPASPNSPSRLSDRSSDRDLRQQGASRNQGILKRLERARRQSSCR